MENLNETSKTDERIGKSALDAQKYDTLFMVLALIPIVNIIFFMVLFILFPFKIKKFLKLKKEKDKNFW